MMRRRDSGAALLTVLVLVLVLSLVVYEMAISSQTQQYAATNLSDRHAYFYAEQSALIKVEEYLYQDIKPPPMRADLSLTEQQQLIMERRKKSDSYHDFWAKPLIDGFQETGKIRTIILDEDRKFNINSLVHPQTGQAMPLQVDLFEKILDLMGIKPADIDDIVEEFTDYVDKDKKGKYESTAKNASMNLFRECLSFENMSGSLFYGHRFPKGELPRELVDPDYAFFNSLEQNSDSFFDDEEDKKEEDPFAEEPIPPLDEWEKEGIRPGLNDLCTVYGDGVINLNTAPITLLHAIFDDFDVATAVIRERMKTPFNDFEQLKQVPGTTQGIAKYQSILGFTSEYFRVEITMARRNIKKTKMSMIRRWEGNTFTLYRGVSVP